MEKETDKYPLFYGHSIGVALYPGGHSWVTIVDDVTIDHIRQSMNSDVQTFAILQKDSRISNFTVDCFAPVGCMARIVDITDPEGNYYHSGKALVEVEGLQRARLTSVEQRGDRLFGTVEPLDNLEPDLDDEGYQFLIRRLDQSANDLIEFRREQGRYGYVERQVQQLLYKFRRGECDFPAATLLTYIAASIMTHMELLECDDIIKLTARAVALYDCVIEVELSMMLKRTATLYRNFANKSRVEMSHAELLKSLADYALDLSEPEPPTDSTPKYSADELN